MQFRFNPVTETVVIGHKDIKVGVLLKNKNKIRIAVSGWDNLSWKCQGFWDLNQFVQFIQWLSLIPCLCPLFMFIIFFCSFGWHQLNWRRQRAEHLPNSVTLCCKPREIREMSLNLVVSELFIPAVNEVSASHCCTRPVSTLKLHAEELKMHSNLHLWIIYSYVWEKKTAVSLSK